jgi:hypothetical protein
MLDNTMMIPYLKEGEYYENENNEVVIPPYTEADISILAYNGEPTKDLNEAVHITINTQKGVEALEAMDKFHDFPIDEIWDLKNAHNQIVVFVLWTNKYHGYIAVMEEED